MDGDITYRPQKLSKMPMFGSLHMESPVIPRMQSKQIYQGSIAIDRSNYGLGSIRLEVLDTSRTGKRSSFLPTNFDDNSVIPKTKKSSFAYEGATVSKLGDPKNQTKANIKKFCTGSKYIGEYNQLGMAGKGVYRYPHGVIYDGYFNRKGEFHGTGMLIYPAGQKVEGIWRNGKLVRGATCLSNDNNPMGTEYCKMPDRRFQIEMANDIMPAGQEYLTNADVPRVIPKGMYDTGGGFYDPQHRLIIDYTNSNKTKTIFEAHDEEKAIIYDLLMESSPSQELLLNGFRRNAVPRLQMIDSVPAEELEQWIKNNCRKAWDEPTGYRGDLYEIWTAGYRDESMAYTDQLKTMAHKDGTHAITKMSVLNNMDLSQLEQIAPNRNKYSKMYSFILHHTQNLQKYLHEGRKCSLQELSNMFTPISSPRDLSKKKEIHIQRRSKNPKSRASSAPGSPRSKSGTYGLRYLLKHHQSNVRKKLIVRTVDDTVDDTVDETVDE